MDKFSRILEIATSEVKAAYFRLSISDGTSIFRERVYCYELYHQIRKIWPKDSPLSLSGEVDKRTHPILKELERFSRIPDFLVHNPGTMDENYAIVEVKNSIKNKEAVIKDLETLNLFLQKANYKRAIYLIYGEDANEEGTEKIRTIARQNSQDITPIEIWLHSEAGKPATCHYVSQN